MPLNHQRPSAEYGGSHRSPFHHHRESGEWALDPGCVMKTECPALQMRRGRSQEMLPKRHARTNLEQSTGTAAKECDPLGCVDAAAKATRATRSRHCACDEIVATR